MRTSYVTPAPLHRNGKSPWGVCSVCRQPIYTSYRSASIRILGTSITVKAHVACLQRTYGKGQPAPGDPA